MTRAAITTTTLLATLSFTSTAGASEFTYDLPGALVPSSGTGRTDENVYAPDMRFPIETGPAYANSQVWGHGGSRGPKETDQCDEENFSYPWRDNYCEARDWNMPLCPAGAGHQGQDIRASTCEKDVHWVVAAVDGTITSIGSYSVYLTAPDGTRYDYLHMSNVAVKEGDAVTRGQRLGKVSNQFGTSATTVHLHFNIRQNVAGIGAVFVPTYMSLVESYKELLNPTPPSEPAPVSDAGTVTSVAESKPGPPKETASTPIDPEPEAAPQALDSGCANTPRPAPNGAATLVVGALIAGAIRRRRRLAFRE